MKLTPALKFLGALIWLLTGLSSGIFSQKTTSIAFYITMPKPAANQFRVAMTCTGFTADSLEFKMPAWTPGYYQMLNFADFITGFEVTGKDGKQLNWRKSSKNGWMVHMKGSKSFVINYTVTATVSFVAKNYVDSNRAYISPPGTYLYPAGQLNTAVTVQFIPFGNWSAIATGLEPVKGKPNKFSAPDYDFLYDCPVLMGNLDSFPSFSVNNIPHFFYAYKPDPFDRDLLMNDLKKIITTASGIIGDIPYSHYTFLGIGPGGGGIEHLNSTSVAFTGKELNDPATRIRTYHFLSHEYFHHYNVKRIRPIELGPFDYDNGSKTKMLWLSEGVTVYYENIILKRAGLISTEDMLHSFSSSIKAYEDKPGRWFQTPAEASYATWDDGPFGRTGDDYYKTISPYDKGPALGLLLDFKIRHSTENRKSLDDLMRLLYKRYYLSLSRGFTENEFRQAAEEVAGVSLADFFDYIYTLKQVDYATYLGYAGLSIDTVARVMPQAWLGLVVVDKNDSLRVRQVEWDSPAWKAGIRTGAVILTVNGQNMNAQQFNALAKGTPEGGVLNCKWRAGASMNETPIKLVTKMEKSFEIKPVANPAALQSNILKSWLGE